MSPVSEVARTAGSLFEALKEHPLVLAMVVMNFALLGYLFWTGSSAMEQVYKANNETQQLLAKCVQVEWDQLKALMPTAK
jgi:CHASE3 domain sensor protein